MNTLSKTRKDPLSMFLKFAVWFSALFSIAAVSWIVVYILIKGAGHLKLSLFSLTYNSNNVSLLPALLNTVFMMVLSLLFAIPLGIGAAIYLNEYTKRGSKFVKFVATAAETLSGIPSIVFGLFGALFFVKFLHFGLSILSGSLVLSIMILPLIMRTSQQALEEVPDLYREASYGLGAGKLRTIFRILLPSAAKGIFSGIMLAIGKVAGESAALLFTAGSVGTIATSLFDSGRTLAVHMYLLSCEGLHINESYATAVVLLILMLFINLISTRIEKKIQGENK